MNIIKKNSAQAWLLAARPKTLTGALVPVLIGTALAYSDHKLMLLPAAICALFAIMMQIAANFINDYIDFKKGSDGEDRLGPLRACAQGWITPFYMKLGILVTIIMACAIGCTLLYWRGTELIAIGFTCVLFAYFYSSGPYPLSYKGFGDLLVILFFGFIPV